MRRYASMIILGLMVCVLLGASIAGASSANGGTTLLVGRGVIRDDPWAVVAAGDGPGSVCLSVGLRVGSGSASREVEVCGRAKASRLVLGVEYARQRRHPASFVTVMGGLFSPSARKLLFVKRDGSRVRRSLSRRTVVVGDQRLRKIAFATAGRFCPEEVVVLGSQGRELARRPWSTVSAGTEGNVCGV